MREIHVNPVKKIRDSESGLSVCYDTLSGLGFRSVRPLVGRFFGGGGPVDRSYS